MAFQPGGIFVNGHAGVPVIGSRVNQHAVTGAGSQAVHYNHFPVRILFCQQLGCRCGGIVHTGNATGKRNM